MKNPFRKRWWIIVDCWGHVQPWQYTYTRHPWPPMFGRFRVGGRYAAIGPFDSEADARRNP